MSWFIFFSYDINLLPFFSWLIVTAIALEQRCVIRVTVGNDGNVILQMTDRSRRVHELRTQTNKLYYRLEYENIVSNIDQDIDLSISVRQMLSWVFILNRKIRLKRPHVSEIRELLYWKKKKNRTSINYGLIFYAMALEKRPRNGSWQNCSEFFHVCSIFHTALYDSRSNFV